MDRLPSLSGLKDAGLEPLYRAALAVAAVAATLVLFIDPLLNLLVVFGVPMTPDQKSAISDFVLALASIGGPLAVAAAARPSVSAPQTVQDILTGPGAVPAGPDFEAGDPEDAA